MPPINRPVPTPGTYLHTIYHQFKSVPLTPFHYRRDLKFTWGGGFTNVQDKLGEFGLDIRRHSIGFYWLVGEWTASGYIDYKQEG